MVSFPVEELKVIKTPCYYYDMDLLQRTLSTVKYEAEKVGAYVHYAVKANANPRILKTVAEFGFGADCVSGREIQAAIDAGFSGDKIMFAGVGKTDEEIHHQIGERCGRAYSCHADAATESADNDQVGCVKQKLKQAGKDNGNGIANDIGKQRTFQHILVLPCQKNTFFFSNRYIHSHYSPFLEKRKHEKTRMRLHPGFDLKNQAAVLAPFFCL